MNEEFDNKHFRLEKIRNGIYAAIAKEGGGAAANAGFIRRYNYYFLIHLIHNKLLWI
ncbi:hypothetical protein [Bacillus sp. 123MFChir2]|uniref:hypothetical protein n=1 Tax=Bacillus sp. 123MFChir2 TaxID=1169144 RepID=UPI0003A48BAD|nr:hypothetical protein [Bacillus sp. 123MFChir2]